MSPISKRGLGGVATGRGDKPNLLHLSQQVDHVPVLGQATVAHDVDVDAGDAKLFTGWRNAHEAAAVSAGVGPADRYPVAFGHDVFDCETERVGPVMEPRRPCLEIGPAVALAGERVVFDVVLGCDLVENIEPALVQNLVVVAADDRLVVVACHDGPPCGTACYLSVTMRYPAADYHDDYPPSSHRVLWRRSREKGLGLRGEAQDWLCSQPGSAGR